eukprot:m.245095 g.245095  ORF g.245095 m.245095 type:complete len:308 (+) comp22568_c3_seq1:34-957(+)
MFSSCAVALPTTSGASLVQLLQILARPVHGTRELEHIAFVRHRVAQMVHHNVVQRGEDALIAHHHIVARLVLVNHKVFDPAVEGHGQRVAEAALSNADQEGARGLGVQNVLCFLASNDTKEPAGKASAIVLASALFLLHLLEPAHGSCTLHAFAGDGVGLFALVRSFSQSRRGFFFLLPEILGTAVILLAQRHHHIPGARAILLNKVDKLRHQLVLLALGGQSLGKHGASMDAAGHFGQHSGGAADWLQLLVELIHMEVAQKHFGFANFIALQTRLLQDGIARGTSRRRLRPNLKSQHVVSLDKVGK